MLLATLAVSPHLTFGNETAHTHPLATGTGTSAASAHAAPAGSDNSATSSDVPSERPGSLVLSHDAGGGDHPPGGGHHHHGGEQGAASLAAVVLLRDGKHVTEELPEGFLGAVRASGGRERPD